MHIKNCKRCGRDFNSMEKNAKICPNCRNDGKKNCMKYDRCPDWLKRAYRRAVKFKCQMCKKHESKVGTLEPHRIIRSNKGGKYTACDLKDVQNNIKVVCKACHKLLHSNEFKHISKSY